MAYRLTPSQVAIASPVSQLFEFFEENVGMQPHCAHSFHQERQTVAAHCFLDNLVDVQGWLVNLRDDVIMYSVVLIRSIIDA